MTPSHPPYELLAKLEKAHIHFALGRHREDPVLATLTLVGERVEVDVFDDGHMEVSRFLRSEDVLGGKELPDNLIGKNRDSGEDPEVLPLLDCFRICVIP